MIVGAGLAGLVAAHIFPREPVVEAAPEPEQGHKALLRFRSDVVARVTGIDFRRVMVRKGVWYNGAFCAPDIRMANMYSQKCLGHALVGERSVWFTEPAERWVAPENFYDQLVDQVRGRVSYDTAFSFRDADEPVISTAPLPVMLEDVGMVSPVKFRRAPIVVQRFRVPRCDVYQTVHFPTLTHSLYRASITGDMLICELIGDDSDDVLDWRDDVRQAFAFPTEPQALEVSHQRYGKITPVDEDHRRALVVALTQHHNILSLGRFATWRNLLLDDIVDDAAVIKQLMAANTYERRLAAVKRN